MAKLEKQTKIFNESGLAAEKQEQRKQFYEKKAEQVTIAYLIFQSVAFISITRRLSSGQCHHLWVPFTLSLLSSLIYFLALLNTLADIHRLQYQQHLNFMERETPAKQIHEAESHQILSCEQRHPCKPLKPGKIYRNTIVSAVVAFSLLILYAFKSFLCNQDVGESICTGLACLIALEYC